MADSVIHIDAAGVVSERDFADLTAFLDSGKIRAVRLSPDLGMWLDDTASLEPGARVNRLATAFRSYTSQQGQALYGPVILAALGQDETAAPLPDDQARDLPVFLGNLLSFYSTP